ncbi:MULTISPECIES: DUF2769 domain-containing protein [Methanobacterium]|uniref:DUF2769 domain-containing protein n=1 Tax=Methanobacterium formicicum TaxID=2162 RepID=A0A090I3M1_METFO|nr:MULTISPECIES: DUF2769 domain-containing protein [Methanobacterium]KUK75155.1 MAG: Uncharacterized protein XD90_0576 [Methanobacterium sp. 42_16]MDD4809625.1 DUF2769 domain-containing protein [Methanobacterium formicicum]MDG3546856.1 DUF2769 domain-containing protein [Methanobacterium formicicum]MDH2660531.1 DUF2769 domain-containing protein [Methanobacterium formicicum]CEA13868.1 hypothetical protein DSM1535_1535 [Methanobacterium formicicum]
MDRFELIMEKMSEMSEEQLNSLIDMQKKRICVCRSCPTYDQCMTENSESLFCFLGKSQCEVDPAECICSTCPAHDNFQLKHELYCLKGSEEEQRGKS